MKRSKSINIARMRKQAGKSAKPLAAVVAAGSLAACGGGSATKEAKIYVDADHCKAENPHLAAKCEAAYHQAARTAAQSGPAYEDERTCEAEFGKNACKPYNSGYNTWFVPFMAGFIFSEIVDKATDNMGAPLYTSYSPYSRYNNRWVTVDGWDYGRKRYGSVRVSKKTFDPKPKVTKTMSRGGFGSKAATKSSWGGSSSKSSWGG